MKSVLTYLKPHRRALVLSALLLCLSSLCDLLLPTIMNEILNNGVYRQDFDYIVRCCVQMLIVALVGIGSVLGGTWLSCNVVASFCAEVRAEVFRKVHAMSFEEFSAMGTAALTTRCSHDVETLSWIASEIAGPLATIPMMFIGGTVLALRKDAALAGILFVSIPVVLALVSVLGKRVRQLSSKGDAGADDMTDLLRQRLRGIRVIRAFGAEGTEHKRLSRTIEKMSSDFVRANMSMQIISPVVGLLLNLSAVLIVYLGGLKMESGSALTGGDIFAIVEYTALVANSVVMGSFAIVNLPRVTVAAERIEQVLSAHGMDDPVPPSGLKLSGGIRFENVSFRYTGAEAYALHNIRVDIAPGEKMAVIGGTGAGKSTLVSMLLGFRMPTEGAVFLDGRDTRTLSRRDMRENISCSLQSGAIYSGTVAENIRFGRGDATEAEIWDALDAAQATEFVRELPGGLNYTIRQSGKNLSGGQRQRLSIARVLVKDAPIVVFDDSFSALDFLTERALHEALDARLAEKTQLIITQRVSSAMHCDRILVLDGGEQVDCGTHAELLARCPLYRNIYLSQTGGDGHEAV